MNDDENVDLLQKALENEKNENIMKLTTKKIEKIKRKVLEKIVKIDNKQTITLYLSKLKDYIYVDSIDNLKQGSYLRWIYHDDASGKKDLNAGGILTEVKILDNEIQLVIKNFRNKYYTLKFDDLITFQKLNNQELIILLAMDFLHK